MLHQIMGFKQYRINVPGFKIILVLAREIKQPLDNVAASFGFTFNKLQVFKYRFLFFFRELLILKLLIYELCVNKDSLQRIIYFMSQR